MSHIQRQPIALLFHIHKIIMLVCDQGGIGWHRPPDRLCPKPQYNATSEDQGEYEQPICRCAAERLLQDILRSFVPFGLAHYSQEALGPTPAVCDELGMHCRRPLHSHGDPGICLSLWLAICCVVYPRQPRVTEKWIYALVRLHTQGLLHQA